MYISVNLSKFYKYFIFGHLFSILDLFRDLKWSLVHDEKNKKDNWRKHFIRDSTQAELKSLLHFGKEWHHSNTQHKPSERETHKSHIIQFGAFLVDVKRPLPPELFLPTATAPMPAPDEAEEEEEVSEAFLTSDAKRPGKSVDPQWSHVNLS
jgi:hypothetical protein